MPTVKIGSRQLSLSNLDKVLYPDSGFTKAMVIDYYRQIAPVMLPHLKGRPVTLKRYPNGVEGKFFFQKNCPPHPQWVRTADVQGDTGLVHYCLIDSPAALVWVANLAALELHTLLATVKDLTRPTAMVFDLDPGAPATLADCIPLAFRVRALLGDFGLQSLIKTSGGKGLHLLVPLNTAVTFDQTGAFARSVATVLEKDDPTRVTANMRKDKRHGKVFIDWSQNSQHKTTACAYTLRARQQPTVSTPVTWQELEEAERRKDPAQLLTFLAADVPRRVETTGDLFADALKLRQKLPRTGHRA